MTYCVGILLRDGLVMASDSRTNAGVDQVATFRKMTVLHRPGERIITLTTAGNLAISQAILHRLKAALPIENGIDTLYTVTDMFSAAKLVGKAVRDTHDEDGEHLRRHNTEFNSSILLGGQIGSECPRLFNIYSAGNFIEACEETPYFQIGETKYGKPILDRVVTFESSLLVSAKCTLLSFDSTIRSNISVALPIDIFIYRRDSLQFGGIRTVDEQDRYFLHIRKRWGESLRQAFTEMPDPDWIF